MTTTEILKNATVEGNVARITKVQLDRKQYLEVKKAMSGIGGKWKGGKTAGFVFTVDPRKVLGIIQEDKNRNLIKEYQFFETPAKIADKMVLKADLKQTDTVLEPSAGQGAIIKRIHKVIDNLNVSYFEILDMNRSVLEKMPFTKDLGEDFLKGKCNGKFNKIIANPPFSKNRDIEHIYKMYNCLKKGGRLVTLASTHWEHVDNKKEREFREFLSDVDAEIIRIKEGEFKQSGTNIATNMIIINKYVTPIYKQLSFF